MENLRFHTSMVSSFSGFSKPLEESRYVVVGLPYDRTSTYRAGSRFAPRAIRDASLNIETYSLRAGVDIENVPIHDAGDLHVVDDASETLERLSQVTKDIISARKMPIFMGGEHTITFGVVRSLPRSTGLISFDAHGDLRDMYGGGKLSHATVLRRITEVLGTEAILLCGVRALCKEEADFIEKNRIQYVTPWEMQERGVDRAAESLRAFTGNFANTYLTIDADVLDPGFAPGVANPEFGGITPDQLLTLALSAVDERTIGFDVVEVCPNYDTGATSVAAARMIFEMIARSEKERRH